MQERQESKETPRTPTHENKKARAKGKYLKAEVCSRLRVVILFNWVESKCPGWRKGFLAATERAAAGRR